jgi:NO-binding membrane sensor protein with MHYT domain/signal transduction histidine kinase
MMDSLGMLFGHFNFVSGFPDKSMMLPVSYDYGLVILSYLIACIAGYTGLSLSLVIREKYVLQENSTTLLLLGSLSMGAGIWAMHFIAMLAYNIDVQISYDPIITVISIIPAFYASWATLKSMTKDSLSLPCFVRQGITIGAGIGLMHYIGMGAMIQDATPSYHFGIFILSILVAALLGSFTLYLRFNLYLRNRLSKTTYNLISAALWGAAVSGMHYTGMAAVYFTPGCLVSIPPGLNSDSLALPVAVISLLLILSALAFTEFQHRLNRMTLQANLNRDLLSEAIEEMNDGYILTDEDNILKVMNKQMFTILPGSDQYLAVGKSLDSFFVWLSNQIQADEKAEMERDQMVRCMLSIANCENSMEFRLANGRWLMLRQNMTKSGSVMRMWSDITAHKKADEALFQEGKMESMGRMVAGVAHEVNTPLGICLTLSSQLDEQTREIRKMYETSEVSQDKFEQYLGSVESISDIMLSNIRRAANLIRNFKQVAVDQSHLELDRIRLRQYTSQVINTLRSEYKALNPQIIIEGPEELEIITLPGAYSQIIINLVKNSVVHGFHDIEKPEIKITINQADDYVTVTYQDNGVGMDRNTLAKIFDPFFTTRRNKGGTGLGMHIVFNLVHQKLMGKIKVESEVNQGARFIMQLPMELNVEP